MVDTFDVTRSYAGTGDPVYYDGYFDAYVDGYSIVHTEDGYQQPLFFVPSDKAWKHRRALDKLNIGVDQLKQLDGYDGYDVALLQKLLDMQARTKSMIMKMDEAVDDAPYCRVLTPDDIK